MPSPDPPAHSGDPQPPVASALPRPIASCLQKAKTLYSKRKLELLANLFFWLSLGLLFFLYVLDFDQLLLNFPLLPYIALTLLPFSVLLRTYCRHDSTVLAARSEDLSYVRSLIRSAKPFCRQQPSTSDTLSEACQDLCCEVACLEAKLASSSCTEFDVVVLEKKLTVFYDDTDLASKSREKVSELYGYAHDTDYRYDLEDYIKWNTRIERLISKLAKHSKNSSDSSEALRRARQRLQSEYRALLDHVAGYTRDWSEGSTIIKNLLTCTVTFIIVLLLMGLLPMLDSQSPFSLTVIHWGFLATSGSLIGVAIDFRKSNLMAVGDNQGKRELWRAVTGSVLGFMSGVLVWALIAGGLFKTGVLVPNIESSEIQDRALTVIWSIVAGFSFDRVFDQLRSQGDAAFRS